MSYLWSVFRMTVDFSAASVGMATIWFLLGAASALPAIVYARVTPEDFSFLHAVRATRRIGMADLVTLLIGGALGALTVMKYGPTPMGVTVLFFFMILAAVTRVDLSLMLIPDRFVLSALGVSLISILTLPGLALYERVVGFFSVALPLLLITLVVPDAFGGGDIKLMAVCGILLGWKFSVVAVLFAILTGGCYGIYLLLRRRKGRTDVFSFGPFLCFGIVFALLLGDGVVAAVEFYREAYLLL